MSKAEYKIKLKTLEEKYFKALEEEDYETARLIFTSINALMNARIVELEEENKRLEAKIKKKMKEKEQMSKEQRRLERRYGREF